MVFVERLYRLNCLVLLAEFQESREVILLPFCTVLKRFCARSCVFPRFTVFFQREMAATDNEDSTTEKQSEQESSTLIAVLSSMKASIDSGNSLLQELVSHKRSSPDHEPKTSKRRKSCTASRKVNVMSSDEDENDASEKANTLHHHDASEADALSLFRGGDIDEMDDTVLEDMENGDSVHRTQVRQFQVALLS